MNEAMKRYVMYAVRTYVCVCVLKTTKTSKKMEREGNEGKIVDSFILTMKLCFSWLIFVAGKHGVIVCIVVVGLAEPVMRLFIIHSPMMIPFRFTYGLLLYLVFYAAVELLSLLLLLFQMETIESKERPILINEHVCVRSSTSAVCVRTSMCVSPIPIIHKKAREE